MTPPPCVHDTCHTTEPTGRLADQPKPGRRPAYPIHPLEKDAVFAAGAAAVPQFEVSELPAAGVGGESGEPVAINVGEAQLRAGVGAFLADDHPHPLWPAARSARPVSSATQAPGRTWPLAS